MSITEPCKKKHAPLCPNMYGRREGCMVTESKRNESERPGQRLEGWVMGGRLGVQENRAMERGMGAVLSISRKAPQRVCTTVQQKARRRARDASRATPGGSRGSPKGPDKGQNGGEASK